MTVEQTIPLKIQLYVKGLFLFFDNLRHFIAKNEETNIFLLSIEVSSVTVAENELIGAMVGMRVKRAFLKNKFAWKHTVLKSSSQVGLIINSESCFYQARC